MNNYTVYKHTFPNKKIYIGITRQEINKRWGKNGNCYKKQKQMKNAINKYGWGNILHEVLFTNLTKEEAEQKEIELIAYYKSNTKKYGYNIANGGNCKESFSERTKKKISKAHKGIKFTDERKNNISKSLIGIKRSEETKRRVGEKSKGRKTRLGAKLSKESKEKISKALIEYHKKVGDNIYWKGKHHTENTKEKIRQSRIGKPIIQCYKKIIKKDMNGNIIKEYENIVEARNELGLKNSGNIVSCAKGRLKTAYGYKWEYKS